MEMMAAALVNRRTIHKHFPVRSITLGPVGQEFSPTALQPGAVGDKTTVHLLRFEKIWASTARDNEDMRKHVLGSALRPSSPPDSREWINLQNLAEVTVTSEADGYPVESAFSFGAGPGWRAASPGKQRIRLVFDQPQSIKRLRLQFNEPEIPRTQEFIVRWSSGAADSQKEVLRQQWNFSPEGSEIESEDYQVDLKAVSILELTIDPDLGAGKAVATLADWRVA
jgi:hypothetical protein